MSENDGRITPEQAVEAWLRRMSEASRSERSGEVPPPAPVHSSLQILKRRTIRGRQAQALSYRDTTGNPWFWIIRLVEDDDGSWRVLGGGGGSGDAPKREEPWINLAGCWGEHGLALGGRVAGRGPFRGSSARLRIGRTVLTNDTEHDVVLFVTSKPVARSTANVELLTRDGSILWRDELRLT
jgi:hypothetical protein